MNIHPDTGKELRQPHRETEDYAKMVKRMVRGLGRRVAAGDVEAITLLDEVQEELASVKRQAIVGLSEAGYSQSEIALRLGVTRQAVAAAIKKERAQASA